MLPIFLVPVTGVPYHVPITTISFCKCKLEKFKWTCIKKINMGTTEIPHWVERTIIKDKGLYKELMDLYLEAH